MKCITNTSLPSIPTRPRSTPACILTFLFSVATAVMWNGLGFVAKHAYALPGVEDLAALRQ